MAVKYCRYGSVHRAKPEFKAWHSVSSTNVWAVGFGLMIWDTKSTGTLSNVIELLVRKKKSVLFVNKAKSFKDISTVEELDELLSYMSEHAKQKADEKNKTL